MRHDLDRFRKANLIEFLHKGKDVSGLAAAEAMKELAHGVHREGGCFLPVKGAKASVVLCSSLLQRDVTADDLDDVCLLFYELSEVRGHTSLSFIQATWKMTGLCAKPSKGFWSLCGSSQDFILGNSQQSLRDCSGCSVDPD